MVSNLLGAAGAIAVLAAVTVLAGPWWALLLFGAGLLWLAFVAHTHEQQPQLPRGEDES